MTPLQRLQLEASEKRQKLNGLLALDELTDEQRGELGALTTRMQDIEVETRAAIVAEPTPEPTDAGPGDREVRALIDGANVGAIFAATLEHRGTDGREREVQQHFGLAPNQIPLAMLESRAVTPAPGDVGTNQAAIIPAVFPQSCAAFLGIDMPTVAVGEAVFPVLTTSATVHVPAENAAAADTTGAFSAEVLSPSRLQAAFFYSREDRARFQGMDEALRMNLSDALSDKLDQQILNGGEGLFDGTNLANNNVSAKNDFESYLSDFAWGRVDGKYASATGELKIVMGSGTYAHAGETYAGTASNKGDLSAVEKLMDVTGGVKVSSHVPAVVSNKQNAVVRLGMRRDMVAPVWEGITLIPDEVTLAGKGQIQVTAVMLHAIKILRAAGFHKQQSQHA